VPLKSVRFEHPKTEKSITLRRKSYLWAGLFGAAYVRWIGYGSVLKAVAINIGFVFLVLVVVGITSTRYVKPFVQFVTLVAMVPLIVWIQGEMMISIIRTAFRRRGWMTRKPD
jgi:hypothetical protein